MRLVVGVSDMKLSKSPDDFIVTHSLGSCIAVAIYDPTALVGGLLHYQLPYSGNNGRKAKENPYTYADTGIPALFKAAYSMGAEKSRIRVKVAGAANVLESKGVFQIGRQNYAAMRKIFWKNGILIDAEDVGGNTWRTVRLEMETGAFYIKRKEGITSL